MVCKITVRTGQESTLKCINQVVLFSQYKNYLKFSSFFLKFITQTLIADKNYFRFFRLFRIKANEIRAEMRFKSFRYRLKLRLQGPSQWDQIGNSVQSSKMLS